MVVSEAAAIIDDSNAEGVGLIKSVDVDLNAYFRRAGINGVGNRFEVHLIERGGWVEGANCLLQIDFHLGMERQPLR